MSCQEIRSVSIITPSYQQRSFIEQTLRSVVEQKGDFDLDYVVVDGGSTDGSVEFLRDFEWQINMGRIQAGCRKIGFRWLSEKDQGQANAINKGFGLATGDVLTWLNSDDVYADDQAVAKCVAHFRAHPDARFLYGKGYRIDKTGRALCEESCVVDNRVEVLPEYNMILQPAAFWRREVYETVGPLNESWNYVLDYDYWLRCQKHFRLDFLNEFLACKRHYEWTKTATGGIAEKREVVELLLASGKFTERSIKVYFQGYFMPSPAVCAASPPSRDVMRSLLAPTRFVEQRIRRLRKALLRSNRG